MLQRRGDLIGQRPGGSAAAHHERPAVDRDPHNGLAPGALAIAGAVARERVADGQRGPERARSMVFLSKRHTEQGDQAALVHAEDHAAVALDLALGEPQ